MCNVNVETSSCHLHPPNSQKQNEEINSLSTMVVTALLEKTVFYWLTTGYINLNIHLLFSLHHFSLSLWAKGQRCRLDSWVWWLLSQKRLSKLSLDFNNNIPCWHLDLSLTTSKIHVRPVTIILRILNKDWHRSFLKSLQNKLKNSGIWFTVHGRWTQADPFSPSHDFTGVATMSDKFLMCPSSMNRGPSTWLPLGGM